MKKSLVLMAMAGVALAGCVNDVADVQQQEQKAKITFDSPVMYGNVDSRANVYGEIGEKDGYTYPKAENFQIYAVSHTNNFAGWASATATPFNDTSISYDGDVDGWAPKDATDDYYYWEAGQMMTIAASSPAALDVDGCVRSYGADGLTITDFAVNATPEKQYDLLFSTRVANQTANNMNHGADYYSGVPILFQHALSSIRFSLRNTSQAVVKLTGISLRGLKYKGDFKENLVEDETDYAKYDRTSNVTPAWTVDDELIANPYVAFTGDLQFPYEAQYIYRLVEGTTGNTESQLLLMPQALTENSIVTVSYTVNGKTNSKDVCLRGLKSTTFQENGEVKTETPIDSWEIGKRYTYRLFYSDATAKKDRIFFSPSTEGWKDVDVIVVPL